MGLGRGKQAAGGESDESSVLPARWAGWVSPLYPPRSHVWVWTIAPNSSRLGIFYKYFEIRTHVAQAVLELTVWMS